MNDEAANSLLKTLEEPPVYVVLILLTDRPTQVLPTIASRCQPVRFDPPTTEQLAQRLQTKGVPQDTAQAAARLCLGDGEKAIQLATRRRPAAPGRRRSSSPARRSTARSSEKPWKAILDRAKPGAAQRQGRGRAAAQGGAPVPAQEGAQAPRDGVHRAGATRRAPRRDEGARPRAPARRPLVPRPHGVAGGRARARLPQRPRSAAQRGRDRPNLHRRRSSSTTPARA